MYSKWRLATKFIRYYFSSSNGKGHGMHSPFIFHFITKVLNDKEHYAVYDTVERLRGRMLKDQALLSVEDMGAGSSLSKTNKRTIASIAKNAAKPKKFGQLLYRMTKAYQPAIILELGTSLGLSSAYLALGNTGSSVITLEGAKEVAAVARNNFQQLGLTNITIEEGNFDMILHTVVNTLPVIDFAFLDGNHRQEPTERYFNEILPRINNDSILVFDDIHWSKEMEQAWETVKAHPSVRCTVDLFFIGIVFFRQEFKEKQNFVIRF